MDGEQNGTQAQQQDTQQQDTQQQGQQQQTPQQPQQQAQQKTGASGAGKPAGDSSGTSAGQFDSAAYEAQLAQRDSRIAELEAQVADAAKTAEAAEALRGEIAELKAQGEAERIDFKLQLAGVRNVKAAKALLDEHKGDIEALKAAERWLFVEQSGTQAQQTGKTGLPNAGASVDADKQMKEWREIAGLTDE